ncbi:PAS domain-containing sensor histidine kinase [Caballeronia sp. HLA56]
MRHGIALAALAGAALLAAWSTGLQRLLSACALSGLAQFWLWAGAVTSALLLAASILLFGAQRTARASADRAVLGQKRLEGILRSTTEAIITVDSTQRIVMFNPMAEKVFRCNPSDAIGAPLSRLIPERYRAGHERQARLFERTGVSDRQMGGSRVLHGLRADGKEFPLEASISQTEDDDGKLLTVILRDVTERVKAEAILRQSREELRALSANLQQIREQEKSRIARELHDDLGQTLSALKMEMSVLKARLDAQGEFDDGIAAQMQRMLGLIDCNIASLRRIAAHQRPVMLDDLGLPAAIDWLVEDFIQRHGIEVRHEFDTGDLAFNTDAATAVFRIAEEALTNIVRHAHASRVDLSLSADHDNCVLRVGDDGIGASALPSANAKSFGLLGVRERANALGGRVQIDSMPESGFVLTVVLPRDAVREKESQP